MEEKTLSQKILIATVIAPVMFVASLVSGVGGAKAEEPHDEENIEQKSENIKSDSGVKGSITPEQQKQVNHILKDLEASRIAQENITPEQEKQVEYILGDLEASRVAEERLVEKYERGTDERGGR